MYPSTYFSTLLILHFLIIKLLIFSQLSTASEQGSLVNKFLLNFMFFPNKILAVYRLYSKIFFQAKGKHWTPLFYDEELTLSVSSYPICKSLPYYWRDLEEEESHRHNSEKVYQSWMNTEQLNCGSHKQISMQNIASAFKK